MVNNLKEQIEVLQKRLAVLEKKRLIAGANLRITEVTEDMTLIEQVRSDENSESFSGTTDEAGSIFETPSAAGSRDEVCILFSTRERIGTAMPSI